MKNFTLLLVLFFTFTLTAQVNLYYEDFESYTPTDNVGEDTDIPAGFLSYDVDGDGYNWGLTNPINFTQPMGDIYTGNFIMSASYITVGAGGNGGQGALSPNNILVLPMISIPSDADDVNLTYYVGSGTDTSFFSETYSITVTASSDEADILAATPVFTTTLAFQGGEYNTISLNDFIGQDVYIAFRHHDTFDQWLLGIDEISVDSEILSVTDNQFDGFRYFVNAEELNLIAKKPMEHFKLYNILGQEVISQRLANTTEIIDLSALRTGVYIAKVSIDGATRSVRILKK
jgi:hypothetical protein